MIRGIRGATTVRDNDSEEIIDHSYNLIKEMIDANDVKAEDVVSVLFSATPDLNQAFPAKSLRKLKGWTFVPVMCMQEIDVPDSLGKCIRVMMTVQTKAGQEEIEHIYHHEARKLRPDLKVLGGEKA
ncbi:chorismate mutase [Thalassobacillus pellis]|uniref:chorismate mutase n=1 Tax=Thalassobacillus pellis TaxID=748008 RepID=UPI001961BB2D|nr:chorismate mutase [Thalassobacillus pellis]MBM7552468.1 chorismate mutase [Thalassobacillus pellis]